MLDFLLVAAALQLTATEPGKPLSLKGRCDYTPQAQDYTADTTLLVCNAIKVRKTGNETAFAFNRPLRDTAFQFKGELRGNILSVSRITDSRGKSASASGKCEIFYANDRVSVISCLAKSQNRFVAANFIPSRL